MPRMFLTVIAALIALPAWAQSPDFDIRTHPEHGPYITGPDDLPVYGFITRGRGGDGLAPVDSCNERCRTDWPLVAPPGDMPDLAPGLSADLLTVVQHEGQPVVYYNSWALFNFARDTAQGEPNGHAIHSYGGWWALVRPDGSLIRTGVMPGANDD